MYQLVLVELGLAVLLLGAAAGGLVLLPSVVLAAALVLLALVRRRRRSAREWVAVLLALRARRRAAALAPVPAAVSGARPGGEARERTDPGFAPVVECVPSLRTHAFLDRERRAVGMLGDGTFLTALVRVEAQHGALRPAFGSRALPLGLLRDALEVDGIALESVQVVQHVQPAPAPHLPERSVARHSYAPLQQRTGAPALRLTWVALKLDPELCRTAVAARGGGLAGAQRCLLRVADHVASRLAGAGFRATVLDEEELTSAVATSICVSPMAMARASRPDAPEGRRTAEAARTWRCDDRWHTSYAVGRWPELGRAATPLPRLVSVLSSVPTLSTTFSLTLGRAARGGDASLTGHVRLTGRSETELVGAREVLEGSARSAKLGLVRLDHEQLPGLLATLPLGGAR
ncbi:type VII secretion protein EccE [Streptomyces sp. AJS327]|nr:type VII secretion protein EccE [Streptomyces sp. AJS327]